MREDSRICAKETKNPSLSSNSRNCGASSGLFAVVVETILGLCGNHGDQCGFASRGMWEDGCFPCSCQCSCKWISFPEPTKLAASTSPSETGYDWVDFPGEAEIVAVDGEAGGPGCWGCVASV